MKLKKPAKDHQGEWDLVLDNEGTTVASLRHYVARDDWNSYVAILWPEPRSSGGAFVWATQALYTDQAVLFFKMLGVDTAPLEKLRKEKGG